MSNMQGKFNNVIVNNMHERHDLGGMSGWYGNLRDILQGLHNHKITNKIEKDINFNNTAKEAYFIFTKNSRLYRLTIKFGAKNWIDGGWGTAFLERYGIFTEELDTKDPDENFMLEQLENGGFYLIQGLNGVNDYNLYIQAKCASIGYMVLNGFDDKVHIKPPKAAAKEMTISYEGKRILACAESLYSANTNLVFTDETKTNLKEIKPHILSNESQLTIGFGIYNNDTEMTAWFNSKNIDVTKPLSAQNCKDSFEYLLSKFEKPVSDWLIENGIPLKQTEFDALIIHRWQGNKLDREEESHPDYLKTSILTLLKTENRNREDWRTVFNNRRTGKHGDALAKRTEWELDIYFNGVYESNMWFEPLINVFDNLYKE